jgi:hypothetical protein
MKAVKEALKSKGADDAAIKDFETKAGGYAKKIIANFKDYEFYTGESMNPDGMYVLERNFSTCVLLTCLGSSSSTTARTVSLLTSPCGSTA